MAANREWTPLHSSDQVKQLWGGEGGSGRIGGKIRAGKGKNKVEKQWIQRQKLALDPISSNLEAPHPFLLLGHAAIELAQV